MYLTVDGDGAARATSPATAAVAVADAGPAAAAAAATPEPTAPARQACIGARLHSCCSSKGDGATIAAAATTTGFGAAIATRVGTPVATDVAGAYLPANTPVVTDTRPPRATRAACACAQRD